MTETVEIPTAVLIRALQPVEGTETMFRKRPAARRMEDLCSGPGKLGAAMAIDRSLDAVDLVNRQEIFIEKVNLTREKIEIVSSARIGVDYAGEWAAKPLRFYIRGNKHVSKR